MAATRPSGILILSLASACGCKCVFCGLPDTRPHTVLSRAALVTALDGAPQGVWQEVNLTGGDPLVIAKARRLFPDLLARRDRYAALSVSTAGVPARSALTGLAALDDVPDLEIYVSLDGVGAVHDRVRRRPGAFEEATTFIRAARERPGARVILTCVINRRNLDGLEDLADYAADQRLPVSYAIVNSSDHYIRSLPLYDEVGLGPAEAELADEFLRRRSRQRLDEDLRRVLRGQDRRTPCRLLRDGFLVTSDGAVAICGTSQRMILSPALTEESGGWSQVAARRADLLAGGAAQTCAGCTTNCFAWRDTDDVTAA